MQKLTRIKVYQTNLPGHWLVKSEYGDIIGEVYFMATPIIMDGIIYPYVSIFSPTEEGLFACNISQSFDFLTYCWTTHITEYQTGSSQ